MARLKTLVLSTFKGHGQTIASTVLQLIGIAGAAVGIGMVTVAGGVIFAGLALLALGVAVERT